MRTSIFSSLDPRAGSKLFSPDSFLEPPCASGFAAELILARASRFDTTDPTCPVVAGDILSSCIVEDGAELALLGSSSCPKPALATRPFAAEGSLGAGWIAGGGPLSIAGGGPLSNPGKGGGEPNGTL